MITSFSKYFEGKSGIETSRKMDKGIIINNMQFDPIKTTERSESNGQNLTVNGYLSVNGKYIQIVDIFISQTFKGGTDEDYAEMNYDGDDEIVDDEIVDDDMITDLCTAVKFIYFPRNTSEKKRGAKVERGSRLK